MTAYNKPSVKTQSLFIDGVEVTASAAEINAQDGAPASVSFSFAQGAANVSEVAITVKDAAGDTLAGVFNLLIWLSDAATGLGLTSTSASGTVQAKSASGADFSVLSAKKALNVQTLATGIYTLEITDTAKTAFYVAAQIPNSGLPAVSAQMATGDYGA